MYFYVAFFIFQSEYFLLVEGLPAFDWWFYPPDEVLLKIYMFNITNSEQFLSGIDSKLKVKEVGPIIYR